MSTADLFNSRFFTIAVAIGIAAACALGMMDWSRGVILFLLLLVAIDWVAGKAEGPAIPWADMNVGDKLAYFFPALVLTAFGLVLLIVSIGLLRISSDWLSLGFAFCPILMGLCEGYRRWNSRHCFLDVR